MKTFKVGDVVKCVNPNGRILEGHVGVVVRLVDNFLLLDNLTHTFFINRFVKVSTFKGNVK